MFPWNVGYFIRIKLRLISILNAISVCSSISAVVAPAGSKEPADQFLDREGAPRPADDVADHA
ncbi:MAG: hypothetical protein ABEI86_10500, partial [Halobacteriaceae archaeon]